MMIQIQERSIWHGGPEDHDPVLELAGELRSAVGGVSAFFVCCLVLQVFSAWRFLPGVAYRE